MTYWVHHLNPVAFWIGIFPVTYYFLHFFVCYAIGMFCTWRLCQEGLVQFPVKVALEIYWGLMLAIIIGARIAEIVLFFPDYYFSDPIRMIQIWKGGFSHHGAFPASVIYLWIYARVRKLNPLHVCDLIVTGVPAATIVGRIANFINAECVGRITQVPWAVIFPKHGMVPRHPTQLYEALLEGEVLFFILWVGRKRLKTPGKQLSFFLMGYGGFRFFVEFYREPYSTQLFSVMHLGVSQWLCLVMVTIGLWLFLWSETRGGGQRAIAFVPGQ